MESILAKNNAQDVALLKDLWLLLSAIAIRLGFALLWLLDQLLCAFLQPGAFCPGGVLDSCSHRRNQIDPDGRCFDCYKVQQSWIRYQRGEPGGELYCERLRLQLLLI